MSAEDKQPTNPEDTTQAIDESHCDPWTVGNNVDYNKIVDQFGSKLISEELLDRIERVIGEPVHPWLRRGLFFSHRDLERILDMYEKNEPFYIYTGRGPSSDALHLGHMIPFMFTQWLQRVFNVPLVIQLTDDEKFYFKSYLSLEEASRLGFENTKDIIACGFDVHKTFIFRNTDYIAHLYPTVCKLARHMTYNKIVGTFGFGESDHVGKYFFPAVQAAPSFSECFPHIFGGRTDVQCLIPCAIDQDLYFRLTREIAPPLGLKKPALIHSKFFPALQGPNSKMSASSAESAIYVTDTPEQIIHKIKVYAFSGGRATAEEHRELGGDCDKDVSFQYLRFFEFDDDKIDHVRQEYSSGRMFTSELKQILADTLIKFIGDFQRRRSYVTDETVKAFMTVRDMSPYEKK